MSDIGIPTRVNDAVRLTEARSTPRFVGFLSESEAAEAKAAVKGSKHCFFGGYDGALRTVLGILPDWCDEENVPFPITAFTLSFRESAKLSHRDFLGSLMSLGITRRSVGDILVGQGKAVLFLLNDVADFVKTQLGKVGGEGVILTEGLPDELPENGRTEDCSRTVSSDRLDCIISAICGVSRSMAAEMIEKGNVSVNSLCEQRITHGVKTDDRISVRGFGRYIVGDMSGRSKKGRIILNYKKYV